VDASNFFFLNLKNYISLSNFAFGLRKKSFFYFLFGLFLRLTNMIDYNITLLKKKYSKLCGHL
jgi:hypothetical protein